MAALTAARIAAEVSWLTTCAVAPVVAAAASVRVVVPPPLEIVVARYPGVALTGGVEGTYAGTSAAGSA